MLVHGGLRDVVATVDPCRIVHGRSGSCTDRVSEVLAPGCRQTAPAFQVGESMFRTVCWPLVLRWGRNGDTRRTGTNGGN
jgi:hypothetical protein